MLNNDVIRSVRYILNVGDQKVVDIISLGGGKTTVPEVRNLLRNEEDPSFVFCEHKLLSHFLDGLIYFKRGKDDSKPPFPMELPVSNNVVLKKLRVAFELKEDDMHEILKSADCEMGRSELSALMRKRDHSNYRECGDQILRYFLKGLKLKIRGPEKKPTT